MADGWTALYVSDSCISSYRFTLTHLRGCYERGRLGRAGDAHVSKRLLPHGQLVPNDSPDWITAPPLLNAPDVPLHTIFLALAELAAERPDMRVAGPEHAYTHVRWHYEMATAAQRRAARTMRVWLLLMWAAETDPSTEPGL